MACSRFLSFDLIENPERRDKTPLPSISKMLEDILKYKDKWEDIDKSQNSKFKEKIRKVREEIFLEFLFRVQEGEDIGVSDRGTFEQIYKNRSMFDSVSSNLTTVTDRETCEEILYDRSNICSSDENMEKESQELQKAGSKFKNDNYNLEHSDSLPSPNIVEKVIKSEQNAMSESKKLETLNLFKGYTFLQEDIKRIPQNERKSFLGMIDVQHSIKDCHEVLLQGLIDPSKTGPGIFSTQSRNVEFEGERYVYPRPVTEKIASAAVQAIVDQYHMMLEEIKALDNPIEQLTNSFKCASVLLFSFLALHPFSDGNGRLGRLLCDRCLNIFCPVPTPIYNVYSLSVKNDYIRALVKGRQNVKSEIQITSESEAVEQAIMIMEQKPSDLCSLIIECNWFMWNVFFKQIGENSIQFATSDTIDK